MGVPLGNKNYKKEEIDMKKFLCLILALTLLTVGLVSCSGNDTKDSETKHVHVFADPTCKSAKLCSCGATEGEPLKAHTFENGVCKICEKTLIKELGAIARDQKIPNQDGGYFVTTQNGDNYSADITSVAASISVDGSVDTVWLGAKIVITQEAITSGTYSWEFTRNTYVEEFNRYEVETLKGTFKATELSSASALTVTDIEGFSESDATGIMSTVYELVNDVVEQRIAPLVSASDSNLTMATLGFAEIN